jgi:hypothetical protein
MPAPRDLMRPPLSAGMLASPGTLADFPNAAAAPRRGAPFPNRR